MTQRIVWLFGENNGQTMNNNAWHSFMYAAENMKNTPIVPYFALRRTPEHETAVMNLAPSVRKHVVWHSSAEHEKIFARSHRFFIALAFGDIEPDSVAGGSTRRVPLVHLQHGTVGVKTVGYQGDFFSGTIDAFCTYTDHERQLLQQHNGFKPEQLFDAIYHPRSAELFRRSDYLRSERCDADGEQVLWFLTWRDYLSPEHVDLVISEDPVRMTQLTGALPASEEQFIHRISETLTDASLLERLNTQNQRIAVVFHQFFRPQLIARILEHLGRLSETLDASQRAVVADRVRVSHAQDTDMADAIAGSDMLITDYSSLGYDFTVLGRPVSLYHFDLEDYECYRESYVDLRATLNQHVAYEPHELAQVLDEVNGKVHPFFSQHVTPAIDEKSRQWIRSGGHIKRLLLAMMTRDCDRLGILHDDIVQTDETVPLSGVTQLGGIPAARSFPDAGQPQPA